MGLDYVRTGMDTDCEEQGPECPECGQHEVVMLEEPPGEPGDLMWLLTDTDPKAFELNVWCQAERCDWHRGWVVSPPGQPTPEEIARVTGGDPQKLMDGMAAFASAMSDARDAIEWSRKSMFGVVDTGVPDGVVVGLYQRHGAASEAIQEMDGTGELEIREYELRGEGD